ncbi:synaptic vesicular amine transporter-like [Physella acuta]|uniref:synaptic vesicular amine transporter-like n=1 Tax=Physella acuta TaxID=109671 RepID=UPI0027DB8F97|nr:synaptic vesicular amine transporter-like [Physella acuta]
MSCLKMLLHVWYRVLNCHELLQPMREKVKDLDSVALVIVFLTNMLDNLLLTSVVPIIPAFLIRLDKEEFYTHNNLTSTRFLPNQNSSDPYINLNTTLLGPAMANDSSGHPRFSLTSMAYSENARVGWLLASKAIVQLFANPVGYPILLFGGSIVLFISSLVFAFAESYIPLLVARSLQGLGSAATVIAGMSIVARRYQDDKSRSRSMGIAMGGGAFGVLRKDEPYFPRPIDYLVLQGTLIFTQAEITPLHVLLRDRYIIIATGVVMLTTMSMSVLEPTVPLWAMSTMHVKNWELGLIFLPDSIGYFIGTNCFGVVARNIGRWSCSLACMLLIALCQFCLPFATAVPQLILPHFGLGLGLGITDSAIMPLLALLVDVRHEAFYGCVYAIAQLAVCLAYSVEDKIGLSKELPKFKRDPLCQYNQLMRGMAIINILFSPLCYILKRAPTGHSEDVSLSKSSRKDKPYTQEPVEADEACFSYGRLFDDED